MSKDQNDEFEVEEVDIEECAKAGKRPPCAKRYRIRIDREKYVVDHAIITGPELLCLAGKPVEKWRIHQKLRGGQMDEVKADENVDLRERGIERFVTMELCQTDGEGISDAKIATRRQFRLPEEDEAFLKTVELRWETVLENSGRWLLIHDYSVPDGLTPTSVVAAIRIEGGYPPSKLDMVYFFPGLARSDGKAIPQLSVQSIDGKSFQRWSRHYGWREGVDSVATHFLRVKEWLFDELDR